MAVIMRNLTSLYTSFRRDHKSKKYRFGTSLTPSGKDTGGQPLLDGEIDRKPVSVEMTYNLPPPWIDLIEDSQEDINKIKEKLSQLQKAQQRRLLIVFDDVDSAQPDLEIQALSQTISNLFKTCEDKVHAIASTSSVDSTDKAEITLRRNGQKNIATQLQLLSQTFRKQQKHYVSETKKREVGDNFFDSPAEPDFLDDNFGQGEVQDREVAYRSEEISKITESIIDLNTVFKDLATLVIEQGTVLDCIDYNMDQVVQHTEQGKQQLIKAERHQRNNCSFFTIVTLSCILAVLVVLFILKFI